MTDHPKPIARYESSCGCALDTSAHHGMFPTNEGEWMKVRDHDAALAALETEAFNLATQKTAVECDLINLRTAIEAKAREWKRKGNLKNWQTDPLKEGAAIAWDAAASDLLALLEKKP